MACGGTNDEYNTEAIMMRVVKDELKELPAKIMPPLPEPKPLHDKDEVLIDQIASTIRIFGDGFVKHGILNDTIDGFTEEILNNPQKKDIYLKQVVNHMFSDGKINWGRIGVLFYTVAKMAGKLVNCLPGAVTDMILWTLRYFKDNLLGWVLKMGGWICSIASIACFRIETVPTLYPPKPSGHALAITYLVSGIVLGGCIALWVRTKITN